MAKTAPLDRASPRTVALLLPALWLPLACSAEVTPPAGAGATGGSAPATGGSTAAGASGTGVSAGGSGGSTAGAAGSGNVAGVGGGGAAAGSGGTAPSACTTPGVINPGRSPMRRLNAGEYDTTIRDLMHTTKVFSATFPPDEEGLGFSNNADALVVQPLLAEGYQRASEELAVDAVANLGALAPACDPQTAGAATCARSFIEAFGKKAFRRPLAADEITRYEALFTTGSADATFDDGITLVIEAMLQSPHFLYRLEFGDLAAAVGDVAPLTSHEIASRLSYFLWSSIPDDELFAAADANQLTTPEQVAAQADRMLSHENARDMVQQFHREWLHLDDVLGRQKDPAIYANFDAQLQADLVWEADAFVGDVFWNRGNVTQLFTASYTFLNENVARLYGVPGVSGGELTRVELDPSQRSGILSLGAILAAYATSDQAHPILRGKFVRERLLCEELEPVPNDLMVVVPAVTPGTTTRERFEAHSSNPACVGCHIKMDPIGFGFENYDAVGRWRATDDGRPVNATGEFVEAPSPVTDGAFDGVTGMAARLTAGPDAANCVATMWFRWGNGRQESADDACAIESIRQKFQGASYELRSLPIAIVTADTFRYRKIVGGTQ
jgi:hypothetical protein